MRKQAIHFNKWITKLKITITHCLLVLCIVYNMVNVMVAQQILSASSVQW